MASAEYTIEEAAWPDDKPATQKAIQDFLDGGLKTGIIVGPKDFLLNVRRAARKDEFINVVEVMMRDGKMHIRRKDNAPTA